MLKKIKMVWNGLDTCFNKRINATKLGVNSLDGVPLKCVLRMTADACTTKVALLTHLGIAEATHTLFTFELYIHVRRMRRLFCTCHRKRLCHSCLGHETGMGGRNACASTPTIYRTTTGLVV